MMKRRRKIRIGCDGCRRALDIKADTKVKATGIKGIEDVGLECAHCGKWVHSWYDTLKLKRARVKLAEAAEAARGGGDEELVEAYRKARGKFNVLFDRQQRYAGKRMMKAEG